jgi:hypothetical protein
MPRFALSSARRARRIFSRMAWPLACIKSEILKDEARANVSNALHRSLDVNVRFWHKADVPVGFVNVRFRGNSGHGLNAL